ncbi:MAG TPA: SCO family protein [Gaiellaceae bacterium]|jgi:protein SCO1/2|nr:SCO family protein [Gaiellaceae bacterium]
MPRALLAVLAALAVTLVSGCGSSGSSEPASATTAASRFRGTELTPPRAAPPIALHDAHDRPVTLAGQRGRYVLVTFIYTHCPDVCPLITQNLNAALRQLGPERSRVRVLAVSVDPKGDTPAAVRAYERRMHLVPQFRYLIGSRAELLRVWKAWHVLAVSTKPDLVDHVAYTALVDTTGKERVLYDSSVKARQVLHDLRVLLA